MPFESPVDAAVAAALSMLLEVSGNPKAGNVDRMHEFSDLKYEHFLASATASLPVFIEVARSGKIGEGIYKAVETSKKWHRASNVHFGAYLLLVPLLTAWNAESMFDVAKVAVENLKKTTYVDSIFISKAFRVCKARVISANNLSLQNASVEKLLLGRKVNVYEWMSMAPKENIIARELVEGYKISLRGAEYILSSDLEVNEKIVFLYHRFLSEYLDPLIISKAGVDKAKEVLALAKKALNSENPFKAFEELDELLINQNLNPGTIADIVVSSLYLAFVEGWRF